MALVDNPIYVDRRRSADPSTLEETFELLRERQGMAWIGLYRPGVGEIRAVAKEFRLHKFAVEYAIAAHQRANLERYKTTLFTALRRACYLDDVEQVEFGELQLFAGTDFVVTIRHAESPDLGRVRRRLEKNPDLLRLGPEALLYAILDQVVDECAHDHGMNFTRMPELHFAAGYPLALALMVATSVTLYVVFKRRSWL